MWWQESFDLACQFALVLYLIGCAFAGATLLDSPVYGSNRTAVVLGSVIYAFTWPVWVVAHRVRSK